MTVFVEKDDKNASKPVARHLNLRNHSKQHMVVCGLSIHQGSTESRKTLEQKFIFQTGTLNPFESLYSGQFTLSTQLIKPNYLVILPPTQHHSFFRNVPLHISQKQISSCQDFHSCTYITILILMLTKSVQFL